jgi:hypothetical protein
VTSDKIPKKYDEFVRRVALLAKELQISPSEGLHLFGQIARGFVEHAHARGDAEVEELASAALNRFATGFGGEASEITVKGVPDGGLH